MIFDYVQRQDGCWGVYNKSHYWADTGADRSLRPQETLLVQDVEAGVIPCNPSLGTYLSDLSNNQQHA